MLILILMISESRAESHEIVFLCNIINYDYSISVFYLPSTNLIFKYFLIDLMTKFFIDRILW